jgi:hypothetical protein
VLGLLKATQHELKKSKVRNDRIIAMAEEYHNIYKA